MCEITPFKFLFVLIALWMVTLFSTAYTCWPMDSKVGYLIMFLWKWIIPLLFLLLAWLLACFFYTFFKSL